MSQGEGGELRGAKSWAAQGVVLLMLKLPPPSPTVTGILSQRGCWDHLGSPWGLLIFWRLWKSQRQEARLDRGALWGSRRRSEAGALPCGSPASTATGNPGSSDAVQRLATCCACTGVAQGLVWPSRESDQSTEPDGNSTGGKLQAFFAGIKSLVQFSMWHTHMCLQSTESRRTASC